MYDIFEILNIDQEGDVPLNALIPFGDFRTSFIDVFL
jgi:hypothetical protein